METHRSRSVKRGSPPHLFYDPSGPDTEPVPIPPSALGTEGLISALRSSGVGAYVWDRRENLVRWYGYPHPVFGLSGAFQHPLSSFLRAVHPEDLQRVRHMVDQSIHAGSKWEMQYRVRWRDGSVHWILDRGEPGYDADGEVVSVSGACFEITEQVETEHALAQQRSFLRLVLDQNPNLIFAKDDQGRFTLANRALANFYGTTVGELIGKTDLDFNTHPEEIERLRAMDRRVIRERKESVSREEEWTDARGTRRWLATTKLPLLNEDGSCDQLIGVSVDITERKHGEMELAAQRAFLHQVIDSSPSLIFAKDREGRYTLGNQAAAELLETSVEEMLGKTNADFHGHGDEVDGYRADDQAVFERAETVVVGEEQYTTREGHPRWFHTVKVPLFDADGAVDQVLGVATEITEQKKGQEARARLEESLRQSQKMESIGHLAAGIAHDFNNLLTPILGYAELSIDALPDGHPVRDDLAAVVTAAESASALVQQLLAFGRKQHLEIREVDLNAELEYVTRILKRVIPENIAIDLTLDATVEGVRADPTQLQQILLNLAVNARDAMPSGGRLTIRTERSGELPADSTPGVMITVEDTGCGMSKEVIERAFEPFYTTKERGSRVGLGLSTVYGIVEQHGGSIRVTSDGSTGTRFSIWLPTVGTAPSPAPERPPTDDGPARRGAVLVVEDDPGVRSFVCRALEEEGFEVHAAESGEHALQLARKPEVGIELLLTDLVMPGTDGRTLFEQIAALRPSVRALYMSGYAEDSVATDADAPGHRSDRLLRKPFSANTLVRRVNAALTTGRQSQPFSL